MPVLDRKLFDAPNIDLGPALTECICAWEVLRQLGFSADDIFLFAGSLSDGRQGIRITLRAQGLEFIIDVGAVETEPLKIKQAWERRCDEHNRGLDAPGFQQILRASGIWERRLNLLMALKLKGFSLATDSKVSH